MTRAGYLYESAYSLDDPLAVPTLTVKDELLVAGFVTALAEAVRVGVPVTPLPERFSLAGGRVMDQGARERQHSIEEIRDAKRRLDRANQELMASDSERERENWRVVIRSELRRIEHHQARLSALRHESAQPVSALPANFSSNVDALLQACAALGGDSYRVSPSVVDCLRQVMRDFRIELDAAGELVASASVLVPVGERVAELGPVRWVVGNPKRLRVIPSLRHPVGMPHDGQAGSKRGLAEMLRVAGVAPGGVKVLIRCPLPQVPAIVLHALAGAALPDWVSGRWRQQALIDHIGRVYGDATFAWSGQGVYASPCVNRQAMVDVVSQQRQRGRSVTRSVVSDLLGFESHTQPDGFCAPLQGRGRARPWLPVMSLSGVPAAGLLTATPAERWLTELVPVTCVCGRDDVTVLRVPEVPRDALCPCGRMPDAESFGFAADFSWPEEYQGLRVTALTWGAARDARVRRLDERFGANRHRVSAPGAAPTARLQQRVEFLPHERIGDSAWEVVRPVLPGVKPRSPSSTVSRRGVVDALAYRERYATAFEWLPAWGRCAPVTLYRLDRQWRADGSWARVLFALRSAAEAEAYAVGAGEAGGVA